MSDYYISLPVGVISGVSTINGLSGAITLAAGSGITITPSGNTLTIAATGAGSVTSVGLSLPSIFTVTGSPVTSTGTLTGTLNTQTANTIFSGPTTGAAAIPTFRVLVAADIPAISLTTGVSGILPIANGGTNSSTALSNNRVIQSSGGKIQEAAAITASRALVSDANGIPVASTVTTTTLQNLSGTNSGDVTLTAVGSTPSANSASLSGQALTLQPASSTLPGVVTALAQDFGGAKTIVANANVVTFIVRRINGQTANIQEWQNSFSTVLASMNNSGGLVVQTLSSGTGLFSSSVQINNSADILSLRIKGFAGQSVDLFDMVDSSNNPIFAFGPTGIFNMFGGQQFNVAAILDGSSFSSLEPNARNAKDNTGQLAIDWQNRTLNDLSGNNQILFDNTGGPKIANKIIYYNGEATEGNGVPAIVGYFETIAHPDGGGISDVVYTTVSSGMYRVAVVFVITTAAAGGTFDLNLTWTSEVGGENIQIFDNALTTPARTVFDNTKATVAVNPVIIHCTAATDITISPDFTLIVGSLVYNMYVTVERLA